MQILQHKVQLHPRRYYVIQKAEDPGADICGEIAVADLGIDLTPVEKPYARLADEALLRRILPPRTRRSHKGTYGWQTKYGTLVDEEIECIDVKNEWWITNPNFKEEN